MDGEAGTEGAVAGAGLSGWKGAMRREAPARDSALRRNHRVDLDPWKPERSAADRDVDSISPLHCVVHRPFDPHDPRYRVPADRIARFKREAVHPSAVLRRTRQLSLSREHRPLPRCARRGSGVLVDIDGRLDSDHGHRQDEQDQPLDRMR